MGLIKKLFKAERDKSSKKKIKALQSIIKKFIKKREEMEKDLDNKNFKKKTEKRLKRELVVLRAEIAKGEKILSSLVKEVKDG